MQSRAVSKYLGFGTLSLAVITQYDKYFAKMDSESTMTQQPSFIGTTNLKKIAKSSRAVDPAVTKDSLSLISGSAHKSLGQEISDIIGVGRIL